MKYLVENGANVYAVGEHGNTPLMLAAEKNQLEIVKYLLEKSNNAYERPGTSILIPASFRGHQELVKYLIEKGVDINTKGNNNKTVLMFASYNGHLEIVKFFVENGADINLKDNNGDTAVIWALVNDHKEIADYLIEKGAKDKYSIGTLDKVLWIKVKYMIEDIRDFFANLANKI